MSSLLLQFLTFSSFVFHFRKKKRKKEEKKKGKGNDIDSIREALK